MCLVTHSCMTLCKPWTVVCLAICPWRFSRPEYWSRLPCPSPGDLPNPGMELKSPSLQVDSLPSEPSRKHRGKLELQKQRMELRAQIEGEREGAMDGQIGTDIYTRPCLK